MQKYNPDRDEPRSLMQGVPRVISALCGTVILIIAAGCSSSSDNNNQTTDTDDQAAPPAAANGFVTRTMAVLAKGRFTLNNPWSRSDLETGEDIDPDKLAYDTFASAWVRPYTTTITEYETRRRQCAEDSNSFYPRESSETVLRTYNFTDRKCYTTLQLPSGLEQTTVGDPQAQQVLQRYGYYCGAGYPPIAAFDGKSPAPLDAVDYCCRLHDDGTWAGRNIPNRPISEDSSNECGIAMCLRQATVKGITALPTAAETSRQHWWGEGVAGGSTFVCAGNQSTSARAPVPE